jgi:hypothetical protein
MIKATLNGKTVIAAHSTIPAWGLSYHDVTIDVVTSLTGAVTLVLADLTIKGTVLSGGPAVIGSFYRIVAGAGGWGQELPKRSYSNDAGVKLATVLGDAAQECGETLDMTTVDQTLRLGPYFVRPADQACRLLEQLSPNAWYVGEDGQTRLGQRAKTTLKTATTQTSLVDLARGTVELASDSIAPILPGVTVAGLEAVDVEHELTAKGLRSRIWGRKGTGNSRRLAAFRAIFDQLDPDRAFRGITEYRIVTQDGERLNLQAVRVSTGMPDLKRVMVRPGMAGLKAVHHLGARVLVGFADSNPSQPIVLAFEDAEGGGFLPTSLSLVGGGAAIGRVGDTIRVTAAQLTTAGAQAGGNPVTLTAPYVEGTIASGSPKVTSG